jgi:catechol 2,3-dioxygenase-like lactoylglutathione lyase family enzyme
MSSQQSAAAGASSPTIDEIVLADAPERWAALGFTVADDIVALGSVRLRLAGSDAGRGIVGWSLRALSGSELDGLSTTVSQSPPPEPAPEHPNGISSIDHVVAMTGDLDRSVRALRAAGLDLRRVREQPTAAGAPRQAFFRLGQEILEVVQEPEQVLAEHGGPARPARLWGLALLCTDLDRTVAAMSPHAGAVRDAVQPGRRIATVKRSAGLAVPVAVMSVRPQPG